MSHSSTDVIVGRDEDNLTFGVSDEELEAAASMTTHAGMTFPSAPTVSILFACCGNDYGGGERQPDLKDSAQHARNS